MPELRKTTVKLHKDTYEQIKTIATKNNETVSDAIRNLIHKGLSERVLEENTDLIASITRKQMQIVIKPHIERLAALMSKTGHMASASTFLNVQAFMDLVPDERRKDPVVMYEKARKKAVEYMRTPTDEWRDEEHE